MTKVIISNVFKKDLELIGFLTLSGGLGYILAAYVVKDPVLTAVFAPPINFILYRLKKELEKKGYLEAIKELKE